MNSSLTEISARRPIRGTGRFTKVMRYDHEAGHPNDIVGKPAEAFVGEEDGCHPDRAVFVDLL